MRWEVSPDAARGLARQGPADKSVQTETQLNIVCGLFFFFSFNEMVVCIKTLLTTLEESEDVFYYCTRMSQDSD